MLVVSRTDSGEEWIIEWISELVVLYKFFGTAYTVVYG